MMFLYAAEGAFSGALVFTPILLVFQRAFCQGMSIRRKIGVVIFAFYMAAVFAVVGIPTVGFHTVALNLNILPFVDVVNGPLRYICQCLLNVLMFVPMGFMGSVLYKPFKSLKNTVMLGFSMSLFIEVSQIFTHRATDIDDLIMNTLGAVIGFFLAKPIVSRIKTNMWENGQAQYKGIKELALIVVLVFFVMFFKERLGL